MAVDIRPTQNLSVHETAEQLGISVWSVHQLIRRRELASLKIGSRRLVPQAAVTQYVADHLEGGGS